MLTKEGKAYIEAAIFLLQHAYRQEPISEEDLAEYLSQETFDLDEDSKVIIARNLIYEAQNPENLLRQLINNGWIENKKELSEILAN